MASNLEYVILSSEIVLYVNSLEPTPIEELGSRNWFALHERVQKLHQQSVLEAGSLREETVKETLLTYNKVPILVHDVICISVWREKVFPEILRLEPDPKNSFVPYLVMYHEGTLVSLLETVLYHSECCSSLEDACVDLIDYSAFAVVKMAALEKKAPASAQEISSRSVREELLAQQADLCFEIGLRCVSILRYIVETLDSKPLSACSRILTSHDLPLLLVNLVETQPWCREAGGQTTKYIDGRWQVVKPEDRLKLTRIEGQVWIALHQLLLHPQLSTHYDITDFRKQQLLKLQRHMHDVLLDQMSPLVQLQHWLSRLAMSSLPPAPKRPVILEVLPQIREAILNRSDQEWKRLAQKQVRIMFPSDMEDIMEIAQRLNSAYDPDNLEALSGCSPRCAECGEPAAKKCSKCRGTWYCGRECQVKNWDLHKNICSKLAEHFKVNEK